jgi:NAD(P)-dependent dehydrogenase (short-subunit alcohol dehydrogenase family)
MASSSPPRSVAVVTGHSRGLGAAIADDLLHRGIPVLGVSRSRRTKSVDGLEQAEVDLADEVQLHAWLGTDALTRFAGTADRTILVNNAGLLQPIGRLEQQDPAAVTRAVAVNVGAVLALSAAFARATGTAADRRILHVSSGAARNAYAGWSVYCATKAALDHHARAVVLDRSPRLRIASVAPGVIDTDMQAEIRETPQDNFPDRERFVAMKEEGSLRTPADAAKSLVDHLLSSTFGDEPVTETRR